MTYREEYNDFLKKYAIGATTGEETGFLVARLAQYFADLNTDAGRKEIVYKKKLGGMVNFVDGNGKAISVAKAELDGEATDEYAVFNMAKRELQSCEQMLNAAKSLQRGLQNEYSHMGNS